MTPSINIQPVSWQEGQSDLEAVRVTVFVQEQHVPVAIEMDDRDAHCIHVLARQENRPVGTGRIDIEKQGKIGRVAVLPEYRGQGIGRAMMDSLEADYHEKHLQKLHFAVTLCVFYQKKRLS